MNTPHSEILCITNRHLVQGNYWEQLEKIAASSVTAIILREKDLPEQTYYTYAQKALNLCAAYNKPCILHHFGHVSQDLGVKNFHCSLPYLEEHPDITRFLETLGISIHTPKEAQKAEELGASYIIAGHIFTTACKPDTPPVGLEILKEICNQVTIPVIALGGITPKTAPLLRNLPITGIAAMSGFMQCNDVESYIKSLASK